MKTRKIITIIKMRKIKDIFIFIICFIAMFVVKTIEGIPFFSLFVLVGSLLYLVYIPLGWIVWIGGLLSIFVSVIDELRC